MLPGFDALEKKKKEKKEGVSETVKRSRRGDSTLFQILSQTTKPGKHFIEDEIA